MTMEGNKVVIMSALLVSFVVVLGQIQVEAKVSYTMEDEVIFKPCCPNATARARYDMCRLPAKACALNAGCGLIPEDQTCPPGWQNDIVENTGGKTQVEAKVSYTMENAAVLTSCCPNATARVRYDICRATPPVCAGNAGCILVSGGLRCPPRYPYNMLENTVNEYCKSGCVSSVCGAITTLQDSDASEVVKGAVQKCSNACSAFCTKGSVIQLPNQA